jgi:hypothetical protein
MKTGRYPHEQQQARRIHESAPQKLDKQLKENIKNADAGWPRVVFRRDTAACAHCARPVPVFIPACAPREVVVSLLTAGGQL